MRVIARYSFKNGQDEISRAYPALLAEVYKVIGEVDASDHKTKVSKEKTMPGRMLYSPISLNKAFKKSFGGLDWVPIRVRCKYSDQFYVEGYLDSAT